MKRRDLPLLLEDDDADTYDALQFLRSTDGLAVALRMALAIEACDPAVIALKAARAAEEPAG